MTYSKELHDYWKGLLEIVTPEAKINGIVARYVGDMLAEIDRLTAENSALKEAVKWIPVSERLPERESSVLLWGRNCNNDGAPFEGYLRFGKWWDLNELCEGYNLEDITHWMPLPAPQKDGNDVD